MTDALVRIEFADGSNWVAAADAAAAGSQRAASSRAASAVAGIYFKLGVEHILLGIDHLLFVLALLFIARGTVAPGQDNHRLHGGAQHHAGAGDARLRARAVEAGGGDDRAQHRLRRRRDRVRLAGPRQA